MSSAVNQAQVNALVEQIKRAYPKEYLKNWSEDFKYLKFQKDPVRFGVEILKERYAPDVEEMMMSVANYSSTVAISANATGKSHSAATLAWWYYLCFPNSIVVTASAPPLENLKRILWGEIGKKVSRNKSILDGHTYNVMSISKSEWHYMIGVAIPQSGTPEERMAKFSGKHAPHMMFILDEADAIQNEIFTAIDSCLSGGTVKLLCMFNPRRMSGSCYNLIRDKRANVVHMSAMNHPNVKTKTNVIPGAVTADITIKRINECSIPIFNGEEPDQYCFEVPNFLVGEVAKDDKGFEYPPLSPGWRRVTERRFFHQVLGIFGPEGENQLIQKDWIDKARFRWDDYVSRFGENPPEAVRPVLGADISDIGDDNSALCRRYGDWVARFDRWKGIHPNESADRIAEVAKFVKSHDVKIDGVGLGVDVAPLLRKHGVKATSVIASAKPTKVRKEDNREYKFNKMRDQLCWEVAEWLASDTSMIPPDEKLIEECLVLTYESDKITGKLRVLSKDSIRKLIGRSPDTFDSLALTFAPKNRAPKVWSLS